MNEENRKQVNPFVIFRKKEKAELDPNNILEVHDLYKKYGSFTAVNGISFSVKRRSLFAFLGLNGAGKSTTINMITQILMKTSGKIYIDGKDLDYYPEDCKSSIGIVFQNSVLDNVLTPKENLSLRARYYGIRGDEWKKREKVLVDMLQLQDFYNRPLKKLSGGQKRRVDIARAMVHDPKLLILDEPTTGLDPQTRLSVWDLVNSLRARTGMTVFLTTHYMEEAEKATDVVILNHGQIIAEGTPLELKRQYSGDYVIIYAKRNPDINARLEKEKRRYRYDNDASCYRVIVSDKEDSLRFLNENSDIIPDYEVEKGSMDDVFLNVTGVRNILEEHKEHDE